MPADLALLFLAGTGTALATGLGAIPVFFLGERAATLRPALLGIAAGVMAVASIDGLLRPGFEEGSDAAVLAGVVAGVGFLLLGRRAVEVHEARNHADRSTGLQMSILVFAVLFVHSLPEGFAIGTAYASGTSGLGLFVIVAIAIQNIPEGTSVALPMASVGLSRRRQFWAAVGTSVPQPVGAVVAYLLVEQVSALLPFSFGFAAGAMLALVALELLPEGIREDAAAALIGTALGTLGMLGLSAALGV
jgi:ZIP family zinc transporter